MREILFRGKRTDNGEWVNGTPFIYADRCKMIQAVAIHPDFVDEGNVYYSEGFPVDLETVGQYTGLTDKNGKRIFEGDVVAFDDGHFVVEYFESRMGFGFSGLKGRGLVSGFTMMCWEHLEVIGNIHDHPELLEVRA